ncbi:hypothetical protein ACN20G_24260 [Streptomyces sp. BI20]|uniref:hypothetical protein n=1 Tax=Streptomyces sp. BI20 TaxID=3403460 RepID=UPI003C7760B3
MSSSSLTGVNPAMSPPAQRSGPVAAGVVSPTLVASLAADFGSLRLAVLAGMAGTADPATVSALADPELAEPMAVVLAHAVTEARGAVREAELGPGPADRLGPLRAAARRLTVERRVVEERCKAVRAARARRARAPEVSLEHRVLRQFAGAEYQARLRAACGARGLDPAVLAVPAHTTAAWAREHGLAPVELPAPVRALLALSDAEFVEVLSRDAREAENPWLAHDAVVERWARHTRTAAAWGRYAIGRAERAVVARPGHARGAELRALGDAYQDAAVLAARAREARQREADLGARARAAVAERFGAGISRAHAEAFARVGEELPRTAALVREAVAGHVAGCPAAERGCPDCHGPLVRTLRERAAAPTEAPDPDPDPSPDPGPDTAPDRYALLADLPAEVPVAVVDAAIGDESAICGYGWAAEDGSTGDGVSMAAGSGEAELIGVCAAGLAMLRRHPRGRVAVLCDSAQAVDTVRAVLESGDPEAAAGLVLFPEAARALREVLPERERLEVRWLKGHIGHDLNELADALAGLALRRGTGRIAERTAYKRAREVTERLLGGPPAATPRRR